MRRLSSALITVALIAQPLAAFAFYETPGAVLQAVRFDASAKVFSAEVHGNRGSTYISAWMKGQMEGVEYADAKVNAQVTVDVVDDASHMKGRFKGSVIILNGQMYVKLDSMEGTFEDETLLGTVRLATKKWINFPVDADTVAQIQNAISQTGDPSAADDLYTMTRTPYQYGSSYNLVMKPTGDTSITSLEMKIDTDYKDAVQVSQLTMKGTAGEFVITGQAKAERMKYPLSLTAPVDSVSFDWLLQHLMSIDPSNLLPNADFPVNLQDDEWNDMQDDEWMEEEEDDIAPSVRPPRQRVRQPVKGEVEPVDRVNSGIKKPSRRLLKMGAN